MHKYQFTIAEYKKLNLPPYTTISPLTQHPEFIDNLTWESKKGRVELEVHKTDNRKFTFRITIPSWSIYNSVVHINYKGSLSISIRNCINFVCAGRES